MQRALFVKSTLAALTGGLDIWSTPSPAPAGAAMRILIAADRAGALPQPIDARSFAFGGRTWRGRPSVAPLADGRDGVIATLDVDTYLYGVVPLEAAPAWPSAALQAQAIVARTYALARRTLSRPYDVTVSESDQRYGGVDAEQPATSAAVDATRGAILTYLGGATSVFYASCCGGHTADAAQIWGHAALPYLRGVADPYCMDAPDYRWQRSVALDRLAIDLGDPAGGAITGFVLGPPDDTGRPQTIDVVADTGRTTLSTADFRRRVGTDTVRSTWIRALTLMHAQAGPQVVIEGSGRGHGVGLCQWGARAMSAAGASAAQILAWYFPGTVVTRAGR
jgi:stage II sporulation protein D